MNKCKLRGMNEKCDKYSNRLKGTQQVLIFFNYFNICISVDIQTNYYHFYIVH